jgi:hypothetical protein
LASQQLAVEFLNTVGNGDVWLAIGLALLLGALFLLFGAWIARTVGLLRTDAPAGETIGVGLGSGLIVFAAWWAAIWSGGRSSFTPVAVGFAVAVGLGIIYRRRRPRGTDPGDDSTGDEAEGASLRASRRRPLLVAAGAAGVFVVVIALLYGSTLATSPRDGGQPVEFIDQAFYSILGRDLAATGTETELSATGFSDLSGFPAQDWYHWGEIWLASAVITVFGTGPVLARHLIVLPLIMLAAAALTGTLVRRMTRTDSRSAFLFGVVACVFLSPVPFVPIPYFGSSNVGLVFGIINYGLGAIGVLLAMFGLAVINDRRATWALACFFGSAVVFIVPAHLALGLLTFGGIGAIWMLRLLRALLARRAPVVSTAWRQVIVATGTLLGATVVWGLATGHVFGGGRGTPVVPPFSATWREVVLVTLLGGGAFFAIAIEWFYVRKDHGVLADLYLATPVIVAAGAIVWGARDGDFTMFYAFYGGIAVIATPVAAIAIRGLWQRWRAMKRRGLALGLIVLCGVQLEIGLVSTVLRMQIFGPHDYPPIPISVVSAIRQLPADAKLAYACGTFEEVGFGTARYMSIDAHTGRRVVPMCYSAEYLSSILGAEKSVQVPNLWFQTAPQRIIYPDASAHPSSAAVAAFLKDHGIDYIYADTGHPNTLVVDAVPIAESGGAALLRVP